MLESLSIRNLATIEAVDVAFGPGLNVLSGETGVGKSMLLSAVMLLLGHRSDQDAVRTGASQATVEGRFLLDGEARAAVTAAVEDLDLEDGELIVRRVLKAEGRTTASLNGRLVALGTLRAVGVRLADVQGQREQQSLLREDVQTEALDRFGGLEPLRREFASAWSALREARADRERAEQEGSTIAGTLALHRREAAEIEAASIRTGEEAGLETECRLLANATSLGTALDRGILEIDEGEGAAADVLARLGRELGPDPVRSERAQALAADLRAFARDLRALRDRIDADPARLEVVEARLATLRDLMRKHACDEDGLIRLAAERRRSIARLEGLSASREDLDRRIADGERRVLDLGNELLDGRKRAGAALVEAVRKELSELRLGDAGFAVDPGADRAYRTLLDGPAGPAGFGRPRLLFQPNAGEALRPLAEIASGGELTRVLLATKTCLAGAHRIPLLVLDEIEAGVGGRLGMLLGRRLRGLGREHQVLCITHLPQVASFADKHLRVSKAVEGGRTRTSIEELSGAARLREIAEMIGGAGTSSTALRQAREMVAFAEEGGAA